MVASIGKIASPTQGVSYFEKDGYYAKDDAAHRGASAWAGKGAAALGLSGPVEPEAFQKVLEGEVPGGRRLGRKEMDGTINHRPGRDVTLSAPKSGSLMAMVGGDERIVDAHERAVGRTLARIEKNAVEARLRDPATGAMVRAGDQTLHGDLGTILEWAGNGQRTTRTDTPMSGVSVSVVAEARNHRYQQGLFQAWS